MLVRHKICDYCNGDHTDRHCPIEKRIAPLVRKMIGKWMEHYVGNNIKCPNCRNHSLDILDDNSPSLDAICSCCDKKYEIKSKCLSVKELPDDIIINHGNYFEYINRKKDIDFIMIIYKACRKTKHITLRRIFHIPNSELYNNNNFKVVKKDNNNLCNIYIKNHNIYNRYNLNNHNVVYDFSKEIQQKIEEISV